nr:hypothetical protein [Propionibacterium australiense]
MPVDDIAQGGGEDRYHVVTGRGDALELVDGLGRVDEPDHAVIEVGHAVLFPQLCDRLGDEGPVVLQHLGVEFLDAGHLVAVLSVAGQPGGGVVVVAGEQFQFAGAVLGRVGGIELGFAAVLPHCHAGAGPDLDDELGVGERAGAGLGLTRATFGWLVGVCGCFAW